ncbi:MAG: PD-(D/E)XK nuclease family protein [Actinomycetales bacterium]|nr:PD-(D/E)XK nuclease family protein [Actinomycetales bacterium]
MSNDLRVEIPDWTPPWPVRRGEEFIRVSAAHLSGDDRWICPAQIAAKARPGLGPDRDPSVRMTYPPHVTFPLGLVRDAAMRVLAQGMQPDAALAMVIADAKGDVPDALREVARTALDGYLATIGQLRASGALPEQTVVREFFAFDDALGDLPRVEWSGWGLMHVAQDSTVREFHMLTWDDAGRRERSAARLAVYARVAAEAVALTEGQPRYASWQPAPAQPRAGTTVRVREIGLLDSSQALLIDAPLADALATFREAVSGNLHVLAGGVYNPGSACASCNFRHDCPGVARLPGVLGVAGPSTWTRALSPHDLVASRVCTWQTHLLRDLNLPRVRRESSSAMQRGVAVHAWLESAHGRLMGCTAEDLPVPGDGVGDVAETLGWSREHYAALRPYLLQHLHVCPLGRADVIAAYPEHTLTAWDTDADVVATTRTDLVVEFPEGVVVRETKTVAEAAVGGTPAEVFDRYPQVALSLCLVADGLDPVSGAVRAPRPARIELELLSADGYEVRTFDAADAGTVLAARAVIADAVDRILYTDPSPNPGSWCAWCPVATWCEARQTEVVVELTADVVSETAEGPTRVALLSYAETAVVADDDVPF